MKIKNYLLIFFIVFGLIVRVTICSGCPSSDTFPDTAGWNTEHKGLYQWYGDDPDTTNVEGYGTFIDHITPDWPDQIIGDTTGELYLKVTEILWLDNNNSSHAVFSWAVEKYCDGCCCCGSNCTCGNCCNDKISSFHVRNNGFIAAGWTSPSGSGWSFDQDSEWYIWEKDKDCGGCGGSCCLNEMKVELTNYAGWTIGEAGIDKCCDNSGWINGDGMWVTSQPIPEASNHVTSRLRADWTGVVWKKEGKKVRGLED